MLRMFLLPALLAGSLSLRANEVARVSGPDGRLVVTISLQDKSPQYAISYAGQTMLEPSPLGLQTREGKLQTFTALAGIRTRNIKDRYTLDRSKVSQVDYRANELVCAFANEGADTLQVIFRVSNNDVAFAYRVLPLAGRQGRVVIEKEFTGFDFPAGTTTFITPQARPMTGWSRTKPSYEEGYTRDEPVGTPSANRVGYTFPALFHINTPEGWVLLSETGVGGNYPGTRLGDGSKEGLYSIAFPQAGENNGKGDTTATIDYGALTSWKTITVGKDLQAIVASTVATDVVQPVVPRKGTFVPGRATWSWLIWQDNSCNYKDQVTFIDLAAQLNCEYILIDALWDKMIGRDKMAELVQYARNKGVGVLLWYNSNGDWNDAPQTPLNRMNTASARAEEMGWLQQIGVKGMKVDFFGGDKQVTMQLYHDILTDAAAHGLIVNFHGATLPRGWERMYPNFVASEAVLASENLVFSQGFCNGYATTATLYPFIRNAVASMDFGPLILNKRLSRDPGKGNTRKTTDAFELATTVLFFSAVQHWGLTPESLEGQPAYVLDFIRQVPATWDETRLIDGYPGKYCVLARRKGKRWYVVAVNGDKTARTIDVSLPMFRRKQVTLIRDGEALASVAEQQRVGDRWSITLQPGGGAVLFR